MLKARTSPPLHAAAMAAGAVLAAVIAVLAEPPLVICPLIGALGAAAGHLTAYLVGWWRP